MIVLKSMLMDWCKRYPDDKIIGTLEAVGSFEDRC
jgi:hypothetical protein